MKRIMLLLLAVLLIPIYSHAISLDELIAAIAETPERFDVSRNYGTTVLDYSRSTYGMTNNNSALTYTLTSYDIYPFAPNYICETRSRVVRQGAPNSTLDDLTINGTVSCEVLSVHAYAFDGTFLPKESQKIFLHIQSALKRGEKRFLHIQSTRKEDQQERKPSAFI